MGKHRENLISLDLESNENTKQVPQSKLHIYVHKSFKFIAGFNEAMRHL